MPKQTAETGLKHYSAMIKSIKSIISTLIPAYIIVTFLFFAVQDIILFPGAYFNDLTIRQPLPKNIKEVTLELKEGIDLNGASTNKTSDTVLLYFGGNNENVKRFVKYAQTLKDVDIAALNYRGFAKSEGIPNQTKLFSDSLEIYDRFKSKYKNIIIVGRSLGCSVATHLSSKRESKGLILITPTDSLLEIAKNRYPIFPIELLLKNTFDSLPHTKYIDSPTTILMVKNDTIIPNKNTLALKKNIKNLILFESLENSGHNQIMRDKRLLLFLKHSLKRIQNENH